MPNWWFFYFAASYFVYRLLDEMDGKQARRTSNSSPLGLLFDHGCDAFTMGWVTLMIAKALQCGDSLAVVICMMFCCSTFYFSTLEEYYTGGLFLLPGNGVTDGSAFILTGFVILGFTGNSVMLKTAFWGLRYCDFVTYGIITSSSVHALWAIVAILRHQKKTATSEAQGTSRHPKVTLGSLLAQSLGYFVPLWLLVSISLVGPRPIVYRVYKEG